MQNALSAIGLFGRVRKYITIAQLRQATGPIILHVRSPGAKSYHHWILFLGFDDNDSISIYDPPHSQSSVSLAELMSVWDGFGIEVMDRTSVSQPTFTPEWVLISVFAGVVYLQTRKKLKSLVAIPVTAAIICFAWHLLSPQGLIHGRNAIGYVAGSYFRNEVDELTFEEVLLISKQVDCTFVDARDVESFNTGRLPGSINIPVNSSFIELKRKVVELSKTKLIICYCNSEYCGWSDSVASQLSNLGFNNVYIYCAGLSDWITRNQPVNR